MADINEILSKEALDSIKELDKLLIDADGSITKIIANAKQLDGALKGTSGIKELNQATKDINHNITQLNTVTKQRISADKEAEKTAKKLADAEAKLAAKEKDRIDAINLQVKSIKDAERQNKALRETVKTLDLTTSQGVATLKKYNSTIDENTKFIRTNGDEGKKQSMNVGNYASAWDGVKKYAALASGVLAGAFTAIKFGEQVISSSQYATDDWTRTVSGLKNGWQEFMNSIANWDFSNLINRINEAAQAGRDYAEVVDLMEKRSAGLASSHKVENEEIAKLRLSYYDHNKSAKEKAAIMEEVIRLTQQQSEEDAKGAKQNYQGYVDTILRQKGIKQATLEAYLLFKGSTEEKVQLVEDLKYAENAYYNNRALLGENDPFVQKNYKEMIRLRVMGVGQFSAIESKLNKDQIDQARTLFDAVSDANKAVYENKEGYFRKMEMQEKKDENLTAKQIKNAEKLPTEYEKLTKHITSLREQIASALTTTGQVPEGLARQLIGSEAELNIINKQVEDITKSIQMMASKGYATTLDAEGKKVVQNIAGSGQLSSRFTARQSPSGPLGASDPTKMNAKDWGNIALESAGTVTDAAFTIIANADQKAFDHKMSLLDKEKEKKLSVANLTEKQKAKIEADYAKKTAKLKEEQFKKEKAASIIQALINTALAVTKAAPNPAQMLLAGLVGAAQVAVIAAQPIPEFDKGTLSTPSNFIAGEKRPEWMRMPSGQWRFVDRPTMFKNLRGATVVSGEQTERLRKAGIRPDGIDLRPELNKLREDVVSSIRNKRELTISATGSKITEREGSYNKEYFNRHIKWAGK